MRVSVVVTTYNLSRYIGQCISSVLHQTHSPYEIIIADDCSSDNTLELARKLSSELIIVRQGKNNGALLNTLSGLNKATGDIVAFIDGDDTWPEDKLQRVVEEFSADPSVVLVTHGHRRVNASGIPLGKFDDTHANIERILQVSNIPVRQKMFRQSILKREGVWFGSAYSIRRSALDLVTFNCFINGQLDARNAYLDLVLAPFFVASNPSGKVAYMSDVIFDYRIHDDNSAASNTVEKQLRALVRGRATNIITKNILSILNADLDVLNKYNLILKEYDFLECLYSKKYFSAFSLLVVIFPYLARKGSIFKEMLRFLMVLALGPSRFLELK